MTMSTNIRSDGKPDALREVYLNAVAEDQGPGALSSEAILAHARQRVAQPQPLNQTITGVGTSTPSQLNPKPAANDRFWLRHALGGLAAVGLVGWLMLQHTAWWDGTDKGVGADPHQAEVVASAPRSELAEPSSAAETASVAQADAAPVAADAAAPVAAPSAAPQAPRSSPIAAAKVQRERMHANAQADEASSAMKNDISAQSKAASRMASTAKMQAESRAPSAEMAVGADGAASVASADKKELLPLCPEEGDEAAQRERMHANARAKSGQVAGHKAAEPPGAKDGVPYCRPRRPEPRPRKPEARDVPEVPDAAVVNPLD